MRGAFGGREGGLHRPPAKDSRVNAVGHGGNGDAERERAVMMPSVGRARLRRDWEHEDGVEAIDTVWLLLALLQAD